MDCSEAATMLDELALDVLPGDRRTALLNHLEECPGCRQLLDELSETADALLLAGPVAAPPPGFEDRVLERIQAPRARAQSASATSTRGRTAPTASRAAPSAASKSSKRWNVAAKSWKSPTIAARLRSRCRMRLGGDRRPGSSNEGDAVGGHHSGTGLLVHGQPQLKIRDRDREREVGAAQVRRVLAHQLELRRMAGGEMPGPDWQ